MHSTWSRGPQGQALTKAVSFFLALQSDARAAAGRLAPVVEPASCALVCTASSSPPPPVRTVPPPPHRTRARPLSHRLGIVPPRPVGPPSRGDSPLDLPRLVVVLGPALPPRGGRQPPPALDDARRSSVASRIGADHTARAALPLGADPARARLVVGRGRVVVALSPALRVTHPAELGSLVGVRIGRLLERRLGAAHTRDRRRERRGAEHARRGVAPRGRRRRAQSGRELVRRGLSPAHARLPRTRRRVVRAEQREREPPPGVDERVCARGRAGGLRGGSDAATWVGGECAAEWDDGCGSGRAGRVWADGVAAAQSHAGDLPKDNFPLGISPDAVVPSCSGGGSFVFLCVCLFASPPSSVVCPVPPWLVVPRELARPPPARSVRLRW